MSDDMKPEYDLSKMKFRRGKTAKSLKVIKTFRIDPEALLWLEMEGAKQGMGYQTFLNWFLRQAMNKGESVEKRLERLEKAVFKKKD